MLLESVFLQKLLVQKVPVRVLGEERVDHELLLCVNGHGVELLVIKVVREHLHNIGGHANQHAALESSQLREHCYLAQGGEIALVLLISESLWRLINHTDIVLLRMEVQQLL